MTPIQNQAVSTIPNVLSDQTVPNTLGGVGGPRVAVRGTGWAGWPTMIGIVVLGIVVAVVLAIGVLLG